MNLSSLVFSLFSVQVGLINPGLPEFFLASGEQLVRSASAAISCLNAEGNSNYMVVVDEVALAKSCDLIYGLLPDPREPMVVGGAWPDHAFTKPEDGTLKEEFLADVTSCVVLKSLTKRSDCFCIQMRPRKHSTKAEAELRYMGEVIASCTLPVQVIFTHCDAVRGT